MIISEERQIRIKKKLRAWRWRLAVPLLPALLGFQAMCWWMFRGRTDGRAPVYR